jgi:hypothetical protein
MDETGMRLSECQLFTIVLPNNKPNIEVSNNTNYADRYDMITFISGETVLPPIIYTPEDRAVRGVKGITGDMLNSFIEDYLARSISGLDKYPLYLFCDKSKIHNIERMKESFENGLCFEIVDISFMPAKASKRLSPLDNGLYHSWKQRVRKHHPITENNLVQLMNDEWMKTTAKQIANAYKHCGLTYSQNIYKDCPLPANHAHAR